MGINSDDSQLSPKRSSIELARAVGDVSEALCARFDFVLNPKDSRYQPGVGGAST